MMGRRRRDQGKLFYEFRLDDRIPKDHLLRRIDVFVTAALADLHQELQPYYSDIGRPSRAAVHFPPEELCQVSWRRANRLIQGNRLSVCPKPQPSPSLL